jgi:hypothetical protein
VHVDAVHLQLGAAARKAAVAAHGVVRGREEVDFCVGPTADDLVGTDQVERREVRVEHKGSLHRSSPLLSAGATLKLNIIPLSWCSAMWQ